MWLFPFACCPSAAASGCSTSPCPACSQLALSLIVKGTHTARPFSYSGWRTRPWIRALSGPISPPSPTSPSLEQWISCWRGFPARTSLPPVAVSVSKAEEAVCSTTCFTLRLEWERDGSSSKTVATPPACEGEPLFGGSSKRLPLSGGMRNGVIYQRPTAAPLTNATDGGASRTARWPTPDRCATTRIQKSASDGAALRPALAAKVCFWSTPTSHDRRQRLGQADLDRHSPKVALQAAVATMAWSTPTRSDGKRGTGASQLERHSAMLSTQAIGVSGLMTSPPVSRRVQMMSAGPEFWKDVQLSRLRLNPLFAEWLMGVCPGWSALAPLEMRSFRLWLRWLSESLQGGTSDQNAL